MYKICFILLLCSAAALAEFIDTGYELCREDAVCIERKLITAIDDLDKDPTVTILGGAVTMERIEESKPISDDEGIVERVSRYLRTHHIQFTAPGSLREAKSLLSEGRSRKLKKLLIPILLLLKLKAWVLVPAVLSAIALIAFKGMGAGLVALALAGATAFKSLLEAGGGSKRVSFEVVPPGHWSRAGLAAPASAPSAPAATAALLHEWPLHGYH